MRVFLVSMGLLVLLGCTSDGVESSALTVFMIEPHETSSHLSEDVEFQASAGTTLDCSPDPAPYSIGKCGVRATSR